MKVQMIQGSIETQQADAVVEIIERSKDMSAGQAGIMEEKDGPYRYRILVVGPRWKNGMSGEDEVIRDCYWNALRLAVHYQCKTIVFPLITGGNAGYDVTEAKKLLDQAVEKFITVQDLEIMVVMPEGAA